MHIWTPNRADLSSIPTCDLAPMLLGTLLITETSDGPSSRLTSGVIVETEAYLGVVDRACHAYGGRCTPRLRTLWSGPGLAYVYTIHNQWLLNVTAQGEGIPECILIRALWPVDGLDIMQARRGVDLPADRPPTPRQLCTLTSGPGRLCRALGIGKALNASDMFVAGSPLRLLRPSPAQAHAAGLTEQSTVTSGPRIGVQSAGADAQRPLRFWIDGNPLVSQG